MRGSRWDDGLLDVFVGFGLLLIGVAWLVPETSRFGGLAPLVLLPLWPIARAWASPVREGGGPSGTHSGGRVARRTVTLAVVALLLGFGMARLALRDSAAADDWVATVIPAFLGVLIGIGAVSVGLLLGVGRLLAYGVVVALLSAAFTAAGMQASLFLTLSGAIVAASGVFVLRRHLAGPERSPQRSPAKR